MPEPTTGSGIAPGTGPGATMIQLGSIHVPFAVVRCVIVSAGRTFCAWICAPVIVKVIFAFAGRPGITHRPVWVQVPGGLPWTFGIPVVGDGQNATTGAVRPPPLAVMITPPTPWPSP